MSPHSNHLNNPLAKSKTELKTVPASLTLGGVDTNRFVPNSASFTLGPNAQPIVAINSIKVSSNTPSGSSEGLNWTTNPLELQDEAEAELHTIDSSTPFLWLPEYACESFARAFNLTYDDNLGLYVYPDNGTTLDNIRNQNVTVTFSIADVPGSSNSVDISLPFAAFDLQLSYPYPGLEANATSTPTNYFPLRIAANYTQYTIGRTFLQEAYLTVDYERNNFSVSQAKFAMDSLTNINLVPITRPANSNFTGSAGSTGQSRGLSAGAMAGVGIGAAALALCFIGFMAYIFIIKKQKKRGVANSTDSDDGSYTKVSELSGDAEHSTRPNSAAEVLGDRRHPTEMVADSTNTRYEMAGTHAFEMPADEVPVAYLNRTNTSGPAELASTDSDIKDSRGPPDRRSSSPAPPAYPQSHSNGVSGDSVNPNNPNHIADAFGSDTVSSGEHGISPIGGPRSADRTSDLVLSPVSPHHNTTEFPRIIPPSHHKLRGAEPNLDTGSKLLTPQQERDQHSRSPSRTSKFMENVDEGQTNPSDSAARATRPSRQPSDHKRFSWED